MDQIIKYHASLSKSEKCLQNSKRKKSIQTFAQKKKQIKKQKADDRNIVVFIPGRS